MYTHSSSVVESAADDNQQVSLSAKQPVSADAAPAQTANRLWDDFDADSDSDASESETADTAAEAPTPTDSPDPDRSFGDVLDTLSSFGQSTSPTQVLVLSPISGGVTNDIFSQICTAEGTATQNVVFVTATRSTNDRLPMTQRFAEWVDGESTLIEVGQPRSDTGTTRDTNTLGRKVDTHKEIPNPQNLAKLGVVISHGINQIDNGYPTVLGFHTLSSMVEHLGTERVVPFLYTLCSQLNESGVMGYCHLDPNRHPDDDVATIKSIFDVAVRIQPDGSVDIE
ncbi:DUF7504 family protein [Halonotius roseus]|uniref:KaiC-like domain-containing protein n=1 Tax=Halonotius roseus TaxID=2511997 RepID=A0A544QQA5_9EURY|nr:hypothetical protein [Halonotius roseus]TQQ81622.1 hypothetical protein EWF95_01375 [Halonotius roseus]